MKLKLIAMSFIALSLASCSWIRQSSSVVDVSKPREALVKALNSQFNAKSYKMAVVQNSSAGMSSVIEAEFVAPANYHVTARMTLNGNATGPQEMIFLDQDTFSRDPDGQWKKMPYDPKGAEAMGFKDHTLIDNLARSKDDAVKVVGEDVLDGKRMIVFQHGVDGAWPLPPNSTRKIWIGAADGLPYKSEVIADVVFKGPPMHLETTTTFSGYNTDLKIQAPM
jgi:hypothetical protein